MDFWMKYTIVVSGIYVVLTIADIIVKRYKKKKAMKMATMPVVEVVDAEETKE